MFQDIQRNKMKSYLIVGIFLIVVMLIVYFICYSSGLSPTAAVSIALLMSIILSWASYYNSDKIVLAVSKARPATEEEDKKMINILDGLMISSGLKNRPRLYIVEDAQPNAFATGRNPQNSIICVTTGLLEKMDYYELEGVIAHEMGHIKNYDIRLAAVVTVMVGFIVIIANIYTRTFMFGRGRDSESRGGNAIFMIVGLVFLILAPILGKLMQMALSRRREFLADATAVEFTRNPDGLISALRKLDEDPNELKTANQATENMYIVNPFKKKDDKKKASLFSTHPSIEDRIAALQNIK